MNKQEEIKVKGFNMTNHFPEGNEEYVPRDPVDYSKIKIGMETLKDVLVDINYFQAVNPLITRDKVLKAISSENHLEMREISEFFYKTSGIYGRLCRYMAFLYRYDWFVVPTVLNDKVNTDKVIEGFYKSLLLLDNFKAKEVFGKIALQVVRQGAYYGYIVDNNGTISLQDLPVKYSRSRFSLNGRPVVEFNMKYFDDMFRDTEQRMKIINAFPKEFKQGYLKYKKGLLPAEQPGDLEGWYMLSPEKAVKFNINDADYPVLIPVILAIMDLAEAKELDKKKMMQQLLKVIAQKLPLDKNGDLVFDVDEARQLHNNAVSMLGGAIGVDILTTFAEVDVLDLADKRTTTSIDELAKVERGVYNEAGVSQMQFNTDGNLALEKSILNDESSMYDLILQFQDFLNILLIPFNKQPKKVFYRVQILPTTIYNYQALSKLYEQNMKIGFSKFLPQIALGQSQSTILASAYFENDILDLNSVFTPPPMSSTTSAKDVQKKDGDGPGRKELPDDEKSEKTIKNKESMA